MDQWKRKASLTLVKGQQGLDLSDLHFRFKVAQQDVQSPNNAEIRVYNLLPNTVRQIREEYSEVVVQAGYEASYGVIFRGTVKQFRVGRESATDSYLDILAADGDLLHNFATMNQTLAAGSSAQDRLRAFQAATAIQAQATGLSATGGILPRGKVLFGMWRDFLDSFAATQRSTWSVQDGKVQVIPLDGYLPGEAVVLTAATGLIGTPESTQEGVRIRCLLNPRLVPGGLVSVDNASINQTLAAPGNPANIPFNQRTGFQNYADVAADGTYRVYVVEHTGDTRGQAWYSDLVGLTLNRSTDKVKSYG